MRWIAHFDADAFFASVEQAADRHLRARPVAVGNLHRGIVASASYEARRYGVYTPMAMRQALKLCPQLVVVPPHFDLYEQFSSNIFGLAEELTPWVEKQSIDEGYLDLGDSSHQEQSSDRKGGVHAEEQEPCDSWTDRSLAVAARTTATLQHNRLLAEQLRRTVKDWLKVTISVGLARTKLLSQIAGKLYKPDHLTIIPPDPAKELAFLHPLPVRWLPSIGEVGSKLFQSAGITRIGQLARLPLPWLSELAGQQARQLRDFANNIDDRAVVAARPDTLSYSHQETFKTDTTDRVFLETTLRRLAGEALIQVRADGKQIRTLTVKIRYTDMEERQGQTSLPEPADVEDAVYPLLPRLLSRLWDRRVRIRMVQVKLSNIYSGPRQLDLFGVKQRQRDLARTLDAIRTKWGKSLRV